MRVDMNRLRALRAKRDDDTISADEMAELEETEARLEHGRVSGPVRQPRKIVGASFILPRRLGKPKGGTE